MPSLTLMREGLQLLVDGAEPESIRSILGGRSLSSCCPFRHDRTEGHLYAPNLCKELKHLLTERNISRSSTC